MPIQSDGEKALKSDSLPLTQPGYSWKDIWKWTVVVVYGLIVLAIIPFHEPWRDEAHSWLTVRDQTIPQIFHQLTHEGYPPLWFLMQAPLAKWGLPYASLGILNALCATLAVAILMFFSPFTLWQKVLIAFSDVLFCWIGMIWRCYSLLALGLFAVAALYPARHRRPVLYALSVLLLANAHVLSTGVALLFFFGFVIGLARRYFSKLTKLATDSLPSTYDLRSLASISPFCPQIPLLPNLLAILIMACGFTVLILGLRQPPDCSYPGLFPFFHWQASLDLLAGTFGRLLFSPRYSPIKIPFYAITVGAFGLFLFDLRKNRDAFWLLLLTFLGWSYVFTFKNAGPSWQHFSPMALMMIAACWLARSDHSPVTGERCGLGRQLPMREAILFASLMFGMAFVPYWIYAEIRYPFSMGKGAAQVLRNVSLQQPIVAFPIGNTGSLLPYLPGRKFWYFETGRFDTIGSVGPSGSVDYNSNSLLKLPVFPEGLPWIVAGYQIEQPPGYELVYPRSPTIPWYVSKEYFWIYRPKSASVNGPFSASHSDK